MQRRSRSWRHELYSLHVQPGPFWFLKYKMRNFPYVSLFVPPVQDRLFDCGDIVSNRGCFATRLRLISFAVWTKLKTTSGAVWSLPLFSSRVFVLIVRIVRPLGLAPLGFVRQGLFLFPILEFATSSNRSMITCHEPEYVLSHGRLSCLVSCAKPDWVAAKVDQPFSRSGETTHNRKRNVHQS